MDFTLVVIVCSLMTAITLVAIGSNIFVTKKFLFQIQELVKLTLVKEVAICEKAEALAARTKRKEARKFAQAHIDPREAEDGLTG